MFPWTSMRRAVRVAFFLALAIGGGGISFVFVSFVSGCKGLAGARPDGGVDGAASAPVSASQAPSVEPSPSASAADAEAPAHAAVVHAAGPPSAGNACASKDAKEAVACAPGGFEELTCAGGVWKVSETCRGPGGCKADGAGVHCDPGTPRAGDACPATAAPRCSNVHTVFTCKNGAWESSLCVPPSKCAPNAKNGVAGCK
jgi:hypothetical protein